jgi:hypothetical protein
VPKPLAGQTRSLLGRSIAADRRITRANYYHWQERELRSQLIVYQWIINRYDSDYADVNGMGRDWYLLRARMIKNEIHKREVGP